MTEVPPQAPLPDNTDPIDDERKQQLLAEAGNTIGGQPLAVDPRHQAMLDEEQKRHEEILGRLSAEPSES